jgi:hypothetical protein
MRALMLPIFVHASELHRALKMPDGRDSGPPVAPTEFQALFVWLLLQLGILNKEQVSCS